MDIEFNDDGSVRLGYTNPGPEFWERLASRILRVVRLLTMIQSSLRDLDEEEENTPRRRLGLVLQVEGRSNDWEKADLLLSTLQLELLQLKIVLRTQDNPNIDRLSALVAELTRIAVSWGMSGSNAVLTLILFKVCLLKEALTDGSES